MSDQLSASPEIFSSTGKPGTSLRPDERLYHNAELFYEDVSGIADTFQQLTEKARVLNEVMPPGKGVSRIVFRGIVSDEAVQTIAADGLGATQLEVAMPVSEHNSAAGWFIYLAQNDANRQPLETVDTMVQETSTYMPPCVERRGLPTDWSLKTNLEEEYQAQLADIWEATFGWSDEEIAHLAERLEAEKAKAGPERSVWFNAIAAGDVLLSAAMAERLTLKGRDGQVRLVESTEWRTRRGFEGRGLMTCNLKALNAQIFQSLGENGSGPPLVYAECSYTTRADRAGHGAGFYIPERRYAAQIAIQNVTVDDGIFPPGLRDFIVMRASTPPALERS
jgi:hypothetical protein